MSNKKLTKQEVEEHLPYFTGTSQWYRVSKEPEILLTDGTKFLVESCGLFWFITDFVLMKLVDPKISKQGFLLFTLDVNLETKEAKITIDDGNGNILFESEIPFTDCPIEKVRMYYSSGVLLLPSEY